MKSMNYYVSYFKRFWLLLFAIIMLSMSMVAFTSSAFVGSKERNVASAAEVITLHYFEDPLCSVCAQQKEFMQSLERQRDDIEVITYSIQDTDTFRAFASERGIEEYRIMSPSTFVRDKLLQFNEFGEREEQQLVNAIDGVKDESRAGYSFTIPLIGVTITDDGLPLLALAIVLGSLDGFNICSLGALILILTIVLAFDSRKKIFLFGGAYIFTTVLVYGLLVFVWGQLINALVGSLSIMRLIVGVAAIGGGVWFFKEFIRFYRYGPTCESSNSKIAQKSSKRLLEAFENADGKKLAALVGAVVAFAVAITLVELPCSVGIPVAFTSILVEQGVSLFAYTAYILVYLFFYMLIELIIFTGAVFTKTLWFSGSNAITWITLVGSLVLFFLGVYYLGGL